jgi:CHAT domain-containing protein/tetratricopeptide (TPR) repeat protein
MIRSHPVVFLAALVCALPAMPAAADEPPKKLTEAERKELWAKWNEVMSAGVKAYQTGKGAEAVKAFEEGVAVARRLYNAADFPNGHANLATSLHNLARLYVEQGRLDKAESLLTDALAMQKRLYKGDHPDVATSLHNLARLYAEQGRLDKAEPLLADALAMTKRFYKGDHPDVATSLHSLAALYRNQGKLAEAEPLLADALAMTKRLFGGDHPVVAASLNNLAQLYADQEKLAEAEPMHADALAMRKRLSKGDHPDVATSLHNLARLYRDLGKLDKAESLLADALDMRKRLFAGDHPDVALSLNILGFLYRYQGKLDKAETLLTDALAMQKRLLVGYAAARSEGDALNYAATQLATRSALLSLTRVRAAGDPAYRPGTAYAHLWSTKGTAARVFEQRQARARAAADPAVAEKVSQLAAARRRRADLVLATPISAPAARKQRETDLKALDESIATLTRRLIEALPASARAEKLDAATLADLQKALPPDAALIDYARYTHFEWDDTRPAGQKQTRTARYEAFVVTRDKVAWVDLDTAAPIELTVDAWRAAVAGRDIDPQVPAKVRALVWEPVRKHLPAGTKTVFVCPDGILCALPFAALPGDRPGTIALEEFALATVPYPPFLLDKLWPQDQAMNPPAGALAAGGVDFDAAVAGPKLAEPLVKAGEKTGWGRLPNTVGELNGITRLAAGQKYAVTRLDGEKATTAAVLDALPKAKVAHLATHGFLADPSFRGAFQLDEQDFRQSLRGERIGRVANNPLLMTGLVCAGANREGTPGRGVLTGDALIDLDLSGLELAVLSACETGLGDLGAGGEGVFGLQRAFHYAGARNVVCSLWKVPDASTAALMGLFYANLWEKNLPPVEALRQAQLHLYKNPADIPKLADGFRGPKFVEVKGAGGVEAKPADGKAHPLLWAAFTLSGPGN